MFGFLVNIFHTFWSKLFNKKGKVIFLGLDNSGKTTLLSRLKDDRLSVSQPTWHPHSEELKINNLVLKAFDLGGHALARTLWTEYSTVADGLIFIVDASDPTRFAEAAEELRRLLEIPGFDQMPITVLGNKIDLPGAASEPELVHALGIGFARPQNVEVFMCSVVKRVGYKEAFEWLSKKI
jgi:GTP-binding protein SAR1